MSAARPTVTVEIDFTTNLASGFAYYEKVLADGPLIYYRLQETAGTSAADASGSGLTGTFSGTYTLNQTSGKPVSGESASRYVDIASGGRVAYPPAAAGTTKLTLEAWVYRATLDGSASTFYAISDAPGSGTAPNDWMAWSVRGDGTLHMLSGDVEWTTSTAPITAATWHHVAVVMDVENDSLVFYRNGVAVAATASPSGFESNRIGFQRTGASTWYWGRAPANTAYSTISRIAEPALYTEALSAAQILDHYNAAATTPFSTYTWTNVTSYLDDRAPLTRTLGRETGLGDVAPMTLTFTLLNRDRRFEPEYSSSPYYPNVEPGRPCRVTMTQDATSYDWAFGYIQDFPQQYGTELVGTVPITAACFLERMNQDEMSGWQFREQTAGARQNRVLNIAGLPAAMRAIDTGANSVMAQADVSGNTGGHALQVARTDRGLFFFDGRGYAVFQDGNYRSSNTRSTTSQGTLGHTSIDYLSPDFHAPLSMVKNEIRLRRPGGVEQLVTDATSKNKRGRRSYSDELLLTTDAALATRAAALLADYKDPVLRVRSVTFDPRQGGGFWNHSLGVKLSDRYTWEWDPLQGTTLSRSVFVEGVSDVYQFREGLYLSTWFLSLV